MYEICSLFVIALRAPNDSTQRDVKFTRLNQGASVYKQLEKIRVLDVCV